MKRITYFTIIFFCLFSVELSSQWSQSSSGMWNEGIHALAASGNNIYAGTAGKGIFISTNNGNDWFQSSLDIGNVKHIIVNDNKIMAGTTSGIYSSVDNGLSWELTPFNTEGVYTIAVKGNKVFAGTQKNQNNGNLYVSIDNGNSWALTTLVNQNIYSVAANSSRLYAAASNGLFYSLDEGITWTEIVYSFGALRGVEVDESGLIIVTTGIGVFRSTDSGNSWSQISIPSGASYNPIIISGDNIYIGANNNLGVYFSSNRGLTWTRTSLNKFVYSLVLTGNTLFAGGGISGLYKSTDNGTTWSQPQLCVQNVYALVASGNNLIAGINLAASYSSNNGLSWNYTSFNAQTPAVYSLASDGNGNVYAGTQDYGIVTSQNNGISYSFNHPFVGGAAYALFTSGNVVFAGSPGGVYISNNNGLSFTQTSLNNRVVRSLIISGNKLFAGTENSGIYFSTNNGASWSGPVLNSQTVRALTESGGSLFAGTIGAGIFISTDNGDSWSQTSLNDRDIFSFAVSGNNIYAGSGKGSGFYMSSNNGVTWIQKDEGLHNVQVSSLCIFNNYIYAGTLSSGVFKRSLNELTGIQPVSNEIPDQFFLSQNYPNPFNPSTKIKFAITVGNGRDRSVLIIYNALGREIETLVNEQLNPGTYEINWNAADHPSGVYFYKLSSGNFSQTSKMILIK